MRRRILPLLLALSGAAFARPAAQAQSLEVRAGSWWLTGEDLARGSGMAVSLPVGPRILLELHGQRGIAPRDGIMCSGLVPPGAYCPTETIDVTASAASAAVAYRWPLAQHARWGVGLRTGGGLAVVHSDRIGLTTARTGEDTSPFLLGEVALDAERQLFSSLPLRAVGMIRLGRGVKRDVTCSDCRIPSFNGGFTLGGLELGLAWPLHSPPPR